MVGNTSTTHQLEWLKSKKIDNSKVGKNVEGMELPYVAGGDETIWKIVWQFLKNLNIHVPYHSAILLPGIYPKEMKTCPYED